jgi:hypothetical protein
MGKVEEISATMTIDDRIKKLEETTKVTNDKVIELWTGMELLGKHLNEILDLIKKIVNSL